MRNIIALGIMLVFFVSACGKKEEAKAPQAEQGAPQASPVPSQAPPQALPPGHPATGGGQKETVEAVKAQHGAIKGTKPVKLSPEITAKWKTVELEVADKSSKTKEAVKVSVGEKVAVKNTGFSIKVETFVPDYTIYEDHIGSKTNEPNNPAVLVELFEGNKSVAKGWIFTVRFSSFNSYKHERFTVAILAPAAAKK